MGDLFRFDDLLGDAERDVQRRVRAFCDEHVLPGAAERWERAEFPMDLVPGLGQLGLCGGTISGYGCPGLSPLAAGLVNLELARADGSLQTFWAAQSGLAMQSIAILGSERQRQRWLAPLARFEAVGAFALTEPEHGSDAAGLETRARRQDDGYVLDGAKRWIGNATFADVLVVWARDDAGEVSGFLIERSTPGLTMAPIEGKASQRGIPQADVTLAGVRLPTEARLPGARSFKDTASILRGCRGGIAWAAAGHALACLDAAVAYARERHQFGRPLASFQLVQEKLATMETEVAAMQLLCWRLAGLEAAGRLTDGAASAAKLNNARKARWVAATARDVLGGNGILLERHVARHQADLEGLFTYEGTDSIQALIVGRELTGISAFR